jgi:hypothetical protein
MKYGEKGNAIYEENTMEEEVINNPITVAIDYDLTISRAPNEWARLLLQIKAMHWQVYVVTGRKSTYQPEELRWLMDVTDGVFFTEHKSKLRYMRELGIEVDIWIDDRPESIIYDYDRDAHAISNPCYTVEDYNG